MHADTALLVITLSFGGHWFGGRPATIDMRWAAIHEHPDATVVWQLEHERIGIAKGALKLPPDDGPGVLTLTTPVVRARTVMQWHYRIQDCEQGKVLSAGAVPIHLYPDDQLEGLAARLADTGIAVLDTTRELSGLLGRAGVRHRHVLKASALRLHRSRVIVIAPEELSEPGFEQPALMAAARGGTGVLIFQQSRPRRLMGYGLALRPVPARLAWRLDHPLLRGFMKGDLGQEKWRSAPGFVAVQLPPDEAALEVAFWPCEAAGDDPAPIDAMIVTRTTGPGRIVLCQLPLGNWGDDPRNQRFLVNALDYLTSRPAPTPPPSQRTEAAEEKERDRVVRE